MQKVRKKTSTYLYTRTLFLSASITLLLITLVLEKPIIGFKLNEYFIFFLLGFIPTIIGHGILSYSLKYFSTTIVTSIPVGEPVIASILAWFIFKEKISISANSGNFLNNNQILLKNNVFFESSNFTLFSDEVTFDKKNQTAVSKSTSKFESKGTEIISEGFSIAEKGDIILFKGKTSLMLKQ